MKKKNGFTLIELLAVIVILAIIALIAVPIIMNVINEAKKGAAKDSMYGYVEAIELEVAKSMITNQNLLTGDYTTKTGDLYSGSTKVLSVSFKGTKPDDNGTVTLTNGRVTKAGLTFGGHAVTYNGKVDGGASTPTTAPTFTTGNIGDQVKVKGITGTFHLMKAVSESATMALLIYDNGVATGAFSTNSSPEFSGSNAEKLLTENTRTWQSDITNAGGNASGIVISIPSREEIQTIRSFYGVINDSDEEDTIEWLHVNRGFYTKTVSNPAGNPPTIFAYRGYINSWYLADNVGVSFDYGYDIRPTLYVHKSNLTKVS